MTREEFLSRYWKYYLLLEEQFLNTNNYVDLNTDNLSTYSLQFVNSILLTGAELDTIMKLYCNFLLSARKDISNYANYVLTNDSDIINQEIIVFNGGNLIIKPFEGWQVIRPSDTLKGWKEYNLIKHNRNENFKLATLDNALNLLGCLYILEIKYLKQIAGNNGIDIPDISSKLFQMKNWQYNYCKLEDCYAKKEGDCVILDGGNI